MEQNNYQEALNTYYKLKNEYKIKNKNKFNKEKKCINCQKKGGTIFKFEDNYLKALCNATDKKCNLDIQIKKEKVINIIRYLENLENNIDTIKINIIKVKLNFLFNFQNQETSLEQFKKYKKDLEDINLIYNQIYSKYLDIFYNKNKQDELNNNLILQNELVTNMNLLHKEYLKTNDKIYIVNMMEIYNNELIQLNNKIIKLKYEYNNLEVTNDNSKILKQEKNIFNDYELILEKGNVLSFKR